MHPLIEEIGRAPSLKKVKRALFVQPHPDDNQIGAGGLIAKFVSQGVEVYELTVCDDRAVDIGYNGEGLTTRQKEVINAQKTLGMKNAGFLGYHDKTRARTDDISVDVLKVIREIRPDALFTADPNLENECHSDHIKTANAVKYAVMDAECAFYPELIDGKLRDDTWEVEILGFYYTDKPNTIIDISDFFEKKLESAKCHVSQMSMELIFAISALAEAAAEGTEYEFAEGYRLISRRHIHCFNYPVTPLKD